MTMEHSEPVIDSRGVLIGQKHFDWRGVLRRVVFDPANDYSPYWQDIERVMYEAATQVDPDNGKPVFVPVETPPHHPLWSLDLPS